MEILHAATLFKSIIMTIIFCAMIYIVILIQGVHAVTRQGKLLSFLGAYPKSATRFEKINKIRSLLWLFIKPIAPALTECTTCMASFWTFVVSALHFTQFLYIELAEMPIVLLVFLMLQVAGLGELITSIGSVARLNQNAQLIALNTSAINNSLQQFNELQMGQIDTQYTQNEE